MEQSIEVELAELRETVALKNRIIDSLMAIDKIRDAHLDPMAMLNGIVNFVAENFGTDLCLLALLDQDSEQIELRAIHRKSANGGGELDVLIRRDVFTRAMRFNYVTVWRDLPLFAEIGLPESVEVLLVPIAIKRDEPLGVMLLAVRERPFSKNDLAVMEYLEDHIDSAVVQGHQTYEMWHHNRQLELIYRVDQIRDHHLPMDEMLNAVLQEVVKAIPSEMGFAMLYDQSQKRLSMRATAGEDLFDTGVIVDQINSYVDRSIRDGMMIAENEMDDPVMRSFVCLPLVLAETIIGVIGLVNRYSSNGFTGKDRQLLGAAGSQIDTALYETLEKRRLRAVLDRAVGPRIMQRILESGNDVLKTELMYLTVLYADIRGSTQMAENTPPDIMVAFINDYLHQMNDVVLAFEGTLDKFVGDEVMALFGAPFPQKDHALRAVKVALEMQRVHKRIMERWQKKGVDARPIGIGIATGEMIVGEMGSTRRTDYTVMGRPANLGARICSVAQPHEVLICPDTYRHVASEIDTTPLTPIQFKGVTGETTIYRVNDRFST